MSFWTDIIVYSPVWVDVYPEKVRRFLSTVAAGVGGAGQESELACYGMYDVSGDARRQAANPDIPALCRKLVAQAARAEQIDCQATGEYEPPSWTEAGDTHIGPFFSAEGPPANVCQQLLAAPKTPFAELELVGLRPDKPIVQALSICGQDGYLDISELNLEVGPNIAVFQDDPPEFTGWMRLLLSGEGQPYPLTKQQLIERAQRCDALRRLLNYATECFAVSRWGWTVSCKG